MTNWSRVFKKLKLRNLIHPIKNRYLRQRKGVGCCDVYSLYCYLGKKILPGLRVFRENLNGFPVAMVDGKKMTIKKWEKIVDKMIYAFESIDLEEKGEDIDYKKQQEGLELFGKWYLSLWL